MFDLIDYLNIIMFSIVIGQIIHFFNSYNLIHKIFHKKNFALSKEDNIFLNHVRQHFSITLGILIITIFCIFIQIGLVIYGKNCVDGYILKYMSLTKLFMSFIFYIIVRHITDEQTEHTDIYIYGGKENL